MAGGECTYSCRTAGETREWIHAIINFLKPYGFFYEAHVVNFFKDRLWEAVDEEWMSCLRKEPIENLLRLPSGVVQVHWPASLKKFILTLRSLALPREQADLEKVLPGLCRHSLCSVLTQGMNQKKKHEIEALAAVVSSTARSVGANTVLDVGAGQGYLSQVLSFEYQLSVIAIDACSHHGKITDARAERIKKHYVAKMRKTRSKDQELSMPKTITCRVLSSEMLKVLSSSMSLKRDLDPKSLIGDDAAEQCNGLLKRLMPSQSYTDAKTSMLLAGLHACGDLSVTMLRTFLECEEVKAVVSIGCCYNLLSEEAENNDSQSGFPLSEGMKSAGLSLGRSARDLACQSAERWRCLENDAGLHNFELHAFRAAFQMVLFRYYPEILVTSPAIGRQGKALRRQHHQRAVETTMSHQEVTNSLSTLSLENSKKEGSLKNEELLHGALSERSAVSEGTKSVETYSLFEEFCQSGLCRLGLHHPQGIDFAKIWKDIGPFAEHIGPYWSLRAALGPILEAVILLDRLLFLQEQGNSLETFMLSIFDPSLSPRNMALIAMKI